MRKQDYLLNLIRSLNPNERRYFKLFTSLQPGSKSYLKLYEILEKEDIYDPVRISKKLNTTTKKLAGDKEYLQQVLLRALRNFEQDTNPKASLTHRYLEAEMLKRRGMTEYALSHLDKIYEKTILHEEYGVFVDSFLLRQILVRNIPDPSPEFVSPGLFRQQLMGLYDLVDIKAVFNEMAVHMVHTNDLKGRSEIKTRPVMQKKPDDLQSLQAKAGWYTMKGMIAVAEEGVGHSSAYYTRMALEVYEQNPMLRQIAPEGYIRSHMVAADNLPPDQMELGLKMINKAIAIMEKNELPINERMMYQLKSHAQGQKFIVLHNLSRYSECIELVEQILYPQTNTLRQHNKNPLLYLYAACLLYTGQANKALAPLREILTGDKNNRVDVQLDAMLLELMVQYDLGNYPLIPYFVSSVKKWMKRKEIPAENYGLYLKWMLRISAAAESGKRKEELKAFLNDMDTGKIKILAQEINIRYWLHDKLKK